MTICRIQTLISCTLLLTAGLISAGCNGGNSSEDLEKKEGKKVDAISARENLEKRRICKANLDKVYQILQPSAENINSELQAAVVILNQWFGSCADLSKTQRDVAHPLFMPQTEPEFIANLNSDSVSLGDVLYLRDQLLMRKVVEHVVQDSPTDLEKIRAIYEYTCRNITLDQQLIDPRLTAAGLITQERLSQLDPTTIPRTLQDVVLAGRGLPQDRIWVFATLLEQLNFDSLVMMPPESADAKASSPAILFVLIDDQLLAFCPELAIEFQANAEDANQLWAASALAKDFNSLFNTFPGVTFPEGSPIQQMQAVDWKTADVFLPYAMLSTSRRMEALQIEFAGEMACTIYQPLEGDDANGVGLGERVTSRLKPILEERKLTFWSYPHKMYQQSLLASEEALTLRELSHATLMKEVRSVRANEDQNEEKTYKVSMERQMLKARLQQLLGNETEALRTYIRIRLQFSVTGTGAAVQFENLMRFLQAEDAQYWSAISQYESQGYRAAADTLQNYVARYPNGRWANSARQLQAEALAKNDKPAEAVEILKQSEFPASMNVRKTIDLQNWQTP
ncbi:MAG TPA: hypothetical protein DD473_24450 [Planctomycetaceae bacterium]|nr:hypothetical protein [Planctomycetaceae bacterium]